MSGIATGSIYGLAGTGLVLTYKTSGIFNFGYGAIATAAAYLFYFLHVDKGLDWKLSFLLAVFVAGPLMGLGMERMARRLSLAVNRDEDRRHGRADPFRRRALARSSTARTPSGSGSSCRERSRLSGSAASTSCTRSFGSRSSESSRVVLLYGIFRFTRTGLAMRAVVDDPDLVAMQAVNPVRVRRIAWTIGTTFAALSGVLVLPFIGLDAIGLTFLVVQAFGAAALGTFSSIPLTFVGGLVLGVAADLSKKYILDVSWLSGLPASLPFIVLFVVLLVTPRRKLLAPGSIERRPRLRYQAPLRVRLVTAVVVFGLLALVPGIVGADKLGFYTIGLTQMIILLSLGLLVRTSGQVSLCHSIFAAIGAVAFSQLAVDHGVPWLLALLLAALIVVPVGAIVAIPSIRLSGLFLALATFGFGILVEQLFYARGFMFTVLSSGRPMPRPSFATSDTAYYYVVLAFVVVTALFMIAVHSSRLGRILRGLSDAPVAVATMGLSTNVTRVLVFCISAFFAGIGGILYGSSVHFATSGDGNYTAFYSLVLLAILALAPFGEPWYADRRRHHLRDPRLHHRRPHQGLAQRHLRTSCSPGVDAGWPTRDAGAAPTFLRTVQTCDIARSLPAPISASAAASGTGVPTSKAPSSGLEVLDLGVRFGGLVAVKDLSFAAPLGRITGLIGPNGAGKTSTFDACSGLNRRVSGRIACTDNDVTGLNPAARGRLGIGRTFQRVQLGDALTVADNVALGREAGLAGGRVPSQVFASPKQRQETREATLAALDTCGIAHLAQMQAGRSRPASAGWSNLPGASPARSTSCCSTSLRLGWIVTRRRPSMSCCSKVVRERGSASCWSSTTCRWCSTCAVTSTFLTSASSSSKATPSEVAASPIVQRAYLGSDAPIPVSAQQERP